MMQITEPSQQRRGDSVPCHVYMPEVEWHQPAAMPALQGLDGLADTVDCQPFDAPQQPEHGRLTPWVFWAVVALAFACVLAQAGGWL